MSRHMFLVSVFLSLCALAEAASPGSTPRFSVLGGPETHLQRGTIHEEVSVRGVESRRGVRPLMLASFLVVALSAIFLVLQCMKIISDGDKYSTYRRLAGKEDPCTVSSGVEVCPRVPGI